METKVKILDINNIDYEAIKAAALILKRGGLVVFPTETVYGLGADALNENAVNNIFKAKGRPQDNPLIVHVGSFDMVTSLVKEIPPAAKKIMDKFFPGPITVIMEKSDLVPMVTSAGLNTVGIRMPENIIARELIREAGVPVAAPSANTSGLPSPTEVKRCVEDLDGKVDFILGGGKCDYGLESTVIDCSVYPPVILRPGRVTLEALKEIDENIYIDSGLITGNERPKAPGMKYKHYAPKAKVKIIQGSMQKTVEKINEIVQNYRDDKSKVGIMATDETKDLYKQGIVISLGSRNDEETIGSNLFETLRTLDDFKVDLILSESFEESGIGIAIMNRLKKSAGFDIIKAD
ncbi:MAG: threonylcarbamoyl-AMP synthase [Bacillota bacterium]|nr:threonylcarbamoyl-AMP synthase [Bacillota bacterium]